MNNASAAAAPVFDHYHHLVHNPHSFRHPFFSHCSHPLFSLKQTNKKRNEKTLPLSLSPQSKLAGLEAGPARQAPPLQRVRRPLPEQGVARRLHARGEDARSRERCVFSLRCVVYLIVTVVESSEEREREREAGAERERARARESKGRVFPLFPTHPE